MTITSIGYGGMPGKRKRQKMKVREVEKREFPQHRRFVRSHECIVPDCKFTPVRFCHVRANLPPALRAGKSQKPHDAAGYPGCDHHHDEQHRIGEASFEKKYGVNLLQTALALARVSTCEAVKLKARSL